MRVMNKYIERVCLWKILNKSRLRIIFKRDEIGPFAGGLYLTRCDQPPPSDDITRRRPWLVGWASFVICQSWVNNSLITPPPITGQTRNASFRYGGFYYI